MCVFATSSQQETQWQPNTDPLFPDIYQHNEVLAQNPLGLHNESDLTPAICFSVFHSLQAKYTFSFHDAPLLIQLIITPTFWI